VTGTPIKSSLKDLYGLLRFIRATPFDDKTLWTNYVEKPYLNGGSNYFLKLILK
jgi:E3 ubiquitin-protein ligase SHPRH